MKPSERLGDEAEKIFGKGGRQNYDLGLVVQILDEQAEEIAHLKERLEKGGQPFDHVKNKWAKEVKTLYENRCLHEGCGNCDGTGRGEYGACVHAISCPCPKHSATC